MFIERILITTAGPLYLFDKSQVTMLTDQYKDGECGYVYSDGCHYCTPQEVLHSAILGFCGCGAPQMSLSFIRDGLTHIEQRCKWPDRADFASPEDYEAASKAFWQAIQAEERAVFGSEGGAWFFYYWADTKDLTEHGGSAPGWLSQRGKDFLEELKTLDLT